ncbi:monocarboxylate transporter 7-like [Xyrichtys novacula]|nr:monocarboxylate transporter 7-like [Xyrichtys novacula]
MGYCLTFLPTVTILSQYFNKRRSLVTAVASVGEPLSIFALAPAFSALKDHVGWRPTMAVIGAFQGTIIICGALLRPIIIKPGAESDASSPQELEVLGTSEKVESTNPEHNASNEQLTSYSQDNELTRGSVSTGDSGVQSLKDTEHSSPEEKTLLYKEKLENSEKGSRKSETEEDNDAEKQVVNDEKKPGDEKVSPKKTKLLDFSILRECSFIFYSLFGLFVTLGFFAPQLYIIELSVSRGVERNRATYMLSTMAVTEILGRLSIGWILTRKPLRTKKLLVLLVCVISVAVDLLGFTLVTEFYGLAVCCAIYGFFLGTLTSTHIPMLAEDDVVGIERMSSAAGVYVFIQSFAGLAGPPLGGVLVDMTQNYGSAFYSCAAGMGVGALFLGLVKPAKNRLLCKRRDSEHTEDKHEQNKDSKEQGAACTEDERVNSAVAEECTEVDDISIQDQEGVTKDDQEVISFA